MLRSLAPSLLPLLFVALAPAQEHAPPKPGEESPRYIEDGDIVKGGLGGFDAVQDDIGSIAGDARILMGNEGWPNAG